MPSVIELAMIQSVPGTSTRSSGFCGPQMNERPASGSQPSSDDWAKTGSDTAASTDKSASLTMADPPTKKRRSLFCERGCKVKHRALSGTTSPAAIPPGRPRRSRAPGLLIELRLHRAAAFLGARRFVAQLREARPDLPGRD